MVGAVVGDVIASVHEGIWTKTKGFPLFVLRSTIIRDSVPTVAVAVWILGGEAGVKEAGRKGVLGPGDPSRGDGAIQDASTVYTHCDRAGVRTER